jgi:mono/diheme cytochrome c family protein
MNRDHVAALLFGAAMFTACGSARRGDAVGIPVTASGAALTGRIVFANTCNPCHPGGESGLGPALNDKPLPDFLVRLKVRNGLGSMPAFPESELDDDSLDAILEWMSALRDATPRSPERTD